MNGPLSNAMITAAPAASLPCTVIRPSSGWPTLNLRQLWRYRDLLTTLGHRDIKLRYRQTALGVFWVVAQPLMAAGIFSFVFGRVAHLSSNGIPYFLFTFAGLLAWTSFSNTLTKASTSLVGNSQLISKVYFPRLILPLSTLYSTAVDLAVSSLMMLVLLFAHHIPLTTNILYLPLWLVLSQLLATGIGLYVSALMVSYRDVQYVLPVATQLLLYASPIAYAGAAVPEHLRDYYYLNPLAPLLDAFRWSLLGTGEIAINGLVYSATICVLAFIAGAFAFKRMERLFSDVI